MNYLEYFMQFLNSLKSHIISVCYFNFNLWMKSFISLKTPLWLTSAVDLTISSIFLLWFSSTTCLRVSSKISWFLIIMLANPSTIWNSINLKYPSGYPFAIGLKFFRIFYGDSSDTFFDNFVGSSGCNWLFWRNLGIPWKFEKLFDSMFHGKLLVFILD